MVDFFQQYGSNILATLAGISLITFCLSLLCIPWIVARLPKDYFRNPAGKEVVRRPSFSPKALPLFITRNILGIFLFTAGIAMLFLPGQGIITMVIGLGVMSFPYKQNLLYHATLPNAVRNSMDWLRKKTGKDSFHW